LSEEEDEISGEPPGLTVEALREALKDVPGHLKVTIRLNDDAGGIIALGVELDCEGERHFAIDASNDAEDFE
jgi:hypothetical protein